MRTPAQIAGHPIHPMLVTIPIGLWVFSLVCDLIGLRSGAPQPWATSALYAMVGGIIGAVLAGIPGLVDLLSSLMDKPIRTTALAHMILNLAIVVLYVINAWTRILASVSSNLSLALSVLGILLLLVSGWLGGKMVYEAGVGVHADEALTAPPAASNWEAGRSASRGAPRNRQAAAWSSGERAMASDSGGPSAERRDDNRPLAGERSRE